jgi:ComF family protein
MREVGTELGKIYGSILKSSDFICDIDLIIPVPLHPDKQKKRGFNQSEIIADGISINTGIPVDTQTLCRKELNPTQTKRSRYERWANVEGIFSLENPDVVIGKHILLVDDVITTGSTVESCANELLKIEGVRVSVVALAYAVM